MNKRKIWSIVFLAVYLLLFVMEIVAVAAVLRLDMLPGLVTALIIIVLLAYDGVVGWLLFLRGKAVPKKMAHKVARKRRIIACVLVLIMVCGCVVIRTVASDVYETLQKVQDIPVEEDPGITRAVYVRTHDSAEELADASRYRFGIVTNYDDVCTQQAIDEIEKQLGTSIQTEGYLSVYEMASALLSGKLDAIILNSGYLSVLEDDERFAMFSDQTRVLADVKIQGNGEELDGSGLLLNAEADIAENGKLKPFVVYLSGSDSLEDKLGPGRSDVNILAAVNPETRQVLLVSTPRDYYVSNPAGAGVKDKLTHCGIFGIENSMNALSELYDHEIQYYGQISFGGFKKVIDALGGITVYSDYAFTAIERTYIKEGENHLSGQEALDFARERYTLSAHGGDRARGEHQMQVIKAVIEKATSGTTIINNYSAIMQSVEGLFMMNIPMPLISQIVKNQIADMSGWNIVSYSAAGTGSDQECYSEPGKLLYVLMPDEASVSKAAKLIDKVFEGEILTSELINSTT